MATSDSPTGPFFNGQNIHLKGFNEIDPAVFIDDDGAAYYLWGQFSLKMARLNPDMVSLDTMSIADGLLTEGAHHFHEGASLTKRNGIYYLVFADISRGDVPACRAFTPCGCRSAARRGTCYRSTGWSFGSIVSLSG